MILFFISGVLNTDKNFPFGQNQRAPFSHTLNPVVIPIHGLNIYRTDFEQNQSDQETEQGFDQFQDNLLDNFVEELTPQFYSYDSSDSNEYENGNKQGNEDLTIHHSMNEIPSQISVKDYQILEPLTTGSDQDDLNGKVINSNHVSANKPKYDHTDESSFDFMLITFLENLLPKHDFVEKQLNSDHLIKSVKKELKIENESMFIFLPMAKQPSEPDQFADTAKRTPSLVNNLSSTTSTTKTISSFSPYQVNPESRPKYEIILLNPYRNDQLPNLSPSLNAEKPSSDFSASVSSDKPADSNRSYFNKYHEPLSEKKDLNRESNGNLIKYDQG